MSKYSLFLTGLGGWSGKGQKKSLRNIQMTPKAFRIFFCQNIYHRLTQKYGNLESQTQFADFFSHCLVIGGERSLCTLFEKCSWQLAFKKR